jgi:hypothetical protein
MFFLETLKTPTWSGFKKFGPASVPVPGCRDVRLHDLRHSFASVGTNEGDSLQVIGRLLGHSKITTTQRYAHLSLDPVKDAVERIGGRIAAKLIPGGATENRVMRVPFILNPAVGDVVGKGFSRH